MYESKTSNRFLKLSVAEIVWRYMERIQVKYWPVRQHPKQPQTGRRWWIFCCKLVTRECNLPKVTLMSCMAYCVSLSPCALRLFTPFYSRVCGNWFSQNTPDRGAEVCSERLPPVGVKEYTLILYLPPYCKELFTFILSFCSGISLESLGNCYLLSCSADLLSSPTSDAARINQGAKISKFAHHSSEFAHSMLSYWVWWYSLGRVALHDEISKDFVTCSWRFFFSRNIGN